MILILQTLMSCNMKYGILLGDWVQGTAYERGIGPWTVEFKFLLFNSMWLLRSNFTSYLSSFRHETRIIILPSSRVTWILNEHYIDTQIHTHVCITFCVYTKYLRHMLGHKKQWYKLIYIYMHKYMWNIQNNSY